MSNSSDSGVFCCVVRGLFAKRPKSTLLLPCDGSLEDEANFTNDDGTMDSIQESLRTVDPSVINSLDSSQQ